MLSNPVAAMMVRADALRAADFPTTEAMDHASYIISEGGGDGKADRYLVGYDLDRIGPVWLRERLQQTTDKTTLSGLEEKFGNLLRYLASQSDAGEVASAIERIVELLSPTTAETEGEE